MINVKNKNNVMPAGGLLMLLNPQRMLHSTVILIVCKLWLPLTTHRIYVLSRRAMNPFFEVIICGGQWFNSTQGHYNIIDKRNCQKIYSVMAATPNGTIVGIRIKEIDFFFVKITDFCSSVTHFYNSITMWG